MGRAREAVGRAQEAVGHAHGAVETRVRTVQQRELEQQERWEREEPARQVRNGAFGHGYLLRSTAGSTAPAQVRDWPVRTIGGHTYHLHPRTRVTVAGRSLVLLGDPIDVDRGQADARRIAYRLWWVLRTRGRDALVREAAYLGGRWTLVTHDRTTPGHRLLVLTDALGSQAVCYSTTGGTAVGSHGVLVADALGHGPDDAALELSEAGRTAGATGGGTLPGLLTPYEQVLALSPNCLLEVTTDAEGTAATATQRRYWPFEERQEVAAEEAYPLFRERLTAHVRLLAGLGRPGISLTGGLHSRVTLAAYLPHRRPQDLTFTTFDPRSVRTGLGSALDLFRASRLAQQGGIEHRLLRWEQPPEGHVFTTLHGRTFPVLPPSADAAFAQWLHLPHDLIQLQSTAPDVATTRGRSRTADLLTTDPLTTDPLTPERMAGLWTGAESGPPPELTARFQEWQEVTDFTRERLGGYDDRALFDWEQQVGRWGPATFQEGDFSHRVLLPFNDRRLLELMLSLPAADRASQVLFHRLLAEDDRLRLPDDPWT